MNSTLKWDDSFDFIVVGSGAGALTAAIRAHDLGLKTLIVEKGEYYGGSSAMSGGGLWIPNNFDMPRVGVQDSDEDAIEYLSTITKGKVALKRLTAYVKYARTMLDYLIQKNDLKVQAIGNYCDYYPEAPGFKEGGRTMEVLPFNSLRLGKERKKIKDTSLLMFGVISGIASTARENVRGSRKGQLLLIKRLLLWAINIPARLISWPSLMLGLGQTLVAQLRYGLIKRDVPLWLNSPVKELIEKNGKIIGIKVKKNGKYIFIQAKKGVCLAAGGFEQNQKMREEYLPKPTSTTWSAGNPLNTGDAIQMGKAIGAKLDFMDDAWWTPAMDTPDWEQAWILLYEKNMPHSMYVDKTGNRFINEALPYIDVVNGMYKNNKNNLSVPCFMIFDFQYRRQSALGKLLPHAIKPDKRINPEYWDNILFKADTLEDLANKINIPTDQLTQSVNRFNQFCEAGIDEDFHRGETITDNFWGRLGYKNPNLGAICKPPFYAAIIHAGDLGTKGGLDTNEHAQVLHEDGSIISGLYACGNCSASVMGNSYAGAGSTLGPAMTFGFIAAEHAAHTN